jgi:hypothetical protein
MAKNSKNDWICEECGEQIHRCGNNLYCENGCFEDDIRNNYSEDHLEQYGINDSDYPMDENNGEN